MRCLVTILVLLLLLAGVFLSGSHAAYCNVKILHYSVTNFNRAGIPPSTFTTQPAISIYANTNATCDSEIQFPGPQAGTTDIDHPITYWVTDCNSNVSTTKTCHITVKPRPNTLKSN